MSSIVKKRVFVGISGGVDSSVAAYLLKKEGYDVTGIFINGYNVDGCAERDAEEARRAAEHIGIPFYVLDLREEYFENVVQYMIDGYKKGLTPNPDVMCNKKIKFGIFLEKAPVLGADYIATGHYVKIKKSKIKNQNDKSKFKIIYKLFEAKDGNKDQSYFLWTLTQEQLKHCLFPIGDYTKQEVRAIAKKAGLPNAERKDSQGICFLGKVKLPDFLREYIKSKRGDVVDTEGNKVGEHNGAQFYTIGQRHIGIKSEIRNPKSETKDKKPYYVVGKDVKNNVLVIAEGSDNPALFKREIELTDVNFIDSQIHSPIRANWRMDILARVRYRQSLFPARVEPTEENSKFTNLQTYKLIFDEPQKFIAPGQSAVFYSQKREMLGGGIIGE